MNEYLVISDVEVRMMSDSETRPEHKQKMYCGIAARYSWSEARWFAVMGFIPFIIGILGMLQSDISYFGLTFDIGTLFGLEPLVLSESVIMIPIYFIVAMIFFAGGIEWYVLCRHCPCYEYSGKEHGNDGRFYCLANWGSPKLFKYDPSPVSTIGRIVFVIWVGFAYLFPVLYFWNRIDWLIVQLLIVVSFMMTLRQWCCSACPNFGCVLNTVPTEKQEEFIKLLESGDIFE